MDAEAADARRARFRLFVQGLSKGTKYALLYAAISIVRYDLDGMTVLERVAAAFINEPVYNTPRGHVGLVQVFVDNGGGTASTELLALVYDTLRGYTSDAGEVHPGWVAAGIDLQVAAATPLSLDVTVTLTLLDGYDPTLVSLQVEDALGRYVQSLQVFAPFILAEATTSVMEVPGVYDVQFVTPTENISVPFNTRIIPGTMTVLV
jgi:phage-related baseplate assembly protein